MLNKYNDDQNAPKNCIFSCNLILSVKIHKTEFKIPENIDKIAFLCYN